MDDIQIKIVREDGKIIYITNDNTSEYRLLNNGLEGFGEYSNEITYIDSATSDIRYYSNMRTSCIDRTIKFCCTNISDNIKRKEIIKFFNPKNGYRIKVNYRGAEKWADGIIAKFVCQPHNNISRTDVTVTFSFETPYWKSEEDFGFDIAYTEPMAGFPYLCANDSSQAPQGFTAGYAKFDHELELNNDGDVDTYLSAYIYFWDNVKNPKFEVNGKYVKVIDNFNENDELNINFQTRPPKVLKNGQNILGKCDKSSEFIDMALKVGKNIIKYGADNGQPFMAVVVYFNKQYGVI